MERAVDERAEPADGAVRPPALGDVLAGRFRLDARVAAGGMATIYRARDVVLDRDVAVKALHPHLAEDATLIERFRTEARSAAALVHPHVVNVFDQGVAGVPYIVMEYVDGPSLRHVLNRRGRLTPGEALAVLQPVCAALTLAHRAGTVHRDVKPENVLVASEDGTVKVTDFGIARILSATPITESGVVLGSVHYLAPEVVLGADATPASDQYAVGLMLFELLTGQRPLPADGAAAVAIRHAREPVPAPSGFVKGVGPRLDAVVARSTALQPGRRYPDLGAFVAALRAAVPGGPRPVVVPAADGSDRTVVLPAPAEDADPTAGASPIRGGGSPGSAAADPAPRRWPAPPWPLGPRRPTRAGTAGAAAAVGGGGVAGAAGPGAPAAARGADAGAEGGSSVAARGADAGAEGGAPAGGRGAGDGGAPAAARGAEAGPHGGAPAGARGAGDGVQAGGAPAVSRRAESGAATGGPSAARGARGGAGAGGGPAVARGARGGAGPRGAARSRGAESGDEARPAGAGGLAGLAAAARRRPLLAAVIGVALLLVLGLAVREVVVPRRSVPDVVADARADAVLALTAADLEPAFADPEPSRDVPEGAVLRTDPPPGAPLRAGDVVTLVVSTGPPLVRAADVVGTPEVEAVAALRAQDLVVRVERAFSRTGVPQGEVEAQDPPSGLDLRVGSEVTLTVSDGVERVRVPDLIGGTRAAAERELAAAGLEMEVTQEFSDDQPTPGEVVRQEPAPGRRAPRGDAVRVVVSAGPATVTVPDLWLRPVEEARAALEDAGLRVVVVEEPAPRLGPVVLGVPGLVEELDPAPGTSVPRGTQVTITTWAAAPAAPPTPAPPAVPAPAPAPTPTLRPGRAP